MFGLVLAFAFTVAGFVLGVTIEMMAERPEADRLRREAQGMRSQRDALRRKLDHYQTWDTEEE